MKRFQSIDPLDQFYETEVQLVLIIHSTLKIFRERGLYLIKKESTLGWPDRLNDFYKYFIKSVVSRVAIPRHRRIRKRSFSTTFILSERL